MKRIGLTMRVVAAQGYAEERDALAWDWHRFLATVFPDACWLSIPNLGNRVDDYVREWRIDGLILTGGNDLGSAPLRDMTEKALLGYAMQLLHEHPVLSRKSIRTSLARDLNATGLPTSLRRLAEVGLAEAVDGRLGRARRS